MIYTTNILALPLIIIVWVVDTYLLLLLARAILRRLSSACAAKLYASLKPFTDPPLQIVKQWLTRRSKKPVPHWLPWAIVMFGGLILRHLIVAIIALISEATV